MTQFGIDISRYQDLNIGSVAKQGFVFFAAKVTEGQGYVDPTYSGNLAEAKQAGALFTAYHFLHSDSSPASQAENVVRHIRDKSVPVMIDCEVSGSSRPNLKVAREFRMEAVKRGLKVGLLYYPHFWWAETGAPNLAGWKIWQAEYPSSKHEFGSTLYHQDGGDKASGWGSQGGVIPTVWQFASSGRLANYSGNVDVDAFRGSRAQLAATGLFKDFSAAPQRHKVLLPTKVSAARVLLDSAYKRAEAKSNKTRADAIHQGLRDLPAR